MTHSKNPQSNTIVVAVGSKNPVKIAAAKEAFEKVFPDKKVLVEGVSVTSGVPDQPMRDEETVRGATNRAEQALEATKADFGLGLEGGIQEVHGEWYTSGWVVIVNALGEKGIGSSIRMSVPPAMVKLIKEGIELGIACDMVFKQSNTKHATGMFGLMTDDALTRTSCYKNGVISALSRFIHPELY